MTQANSTGLLSRAQLKDRAKGALCGKYGKMILAIFSITILSNLFQIVIRSIVSVVLEMSFLSSQTAVSGLSAQELIDFRETAAYAEFFIKWYTPIDYIVSALCQIFTSVFNVGLAYLALNVACGQTIGVSDIFYGYRNHLGKSLKISAFFVLMAQLTQLPSTVISTLATDLSKEISIKKLLGLLGILLICYILYIIIYLGFSQTYFLLLDFPDKSAGSLIKLSFRIMKGHKWRFFLLEFSFLPLLFLCALSLGLGSLLVEPYMQITYTFFFLNLMQSREHN